MGFIVNGVISGGNGIGFDSMGVISNGGISGGSGSGIGIGFDSMWKRIRI